MKARLLLKIHLHEQVTTHRNSDQNFFGRKQQKLFFHMISTLLVLCFEKMLRKFGDGVKTSVVWILCLKLSLVGRTAITALVRKKKYSSGEILRQKRICNQLESEFFGRGQTKPQVIMWGELEMALKLGAFMFLPTCPKQKF